MADILQTFIHNNTIAVHNSETFSTITFVRACCIGANLIFVANCCSIVAFIDVNTSHDPIGVMHNIKAIITVTCVSFKQDTKFFYSFLTLALTFFDLRSGTPIWPWPFLPERSLIYGQCRENKIETDCFCFVFVFANKFNIVFVLFSQKNLSLRVLFWKFWKFSKFDCIF